MKKPLYYLDDYEKRRILEMHESATKKQYLKEDKQILNEFWLPLLGIAAGLGAAGLVWKNWDNIMGKVTEDKFLAINKGCDNPEVEKQKTYNTTQQHTQFAKALKDAFFWGVAGIDMGTKNDEVKSTLSSIKSLADYCKVRKEYKKLYGNDLGNVIDSEVDYNFDSIIIEPLANAIKKSVEDGVEIEGHKTSDDKISTGGDDDSKDDEDFSDGSGNDDGGSKNDGISYKVCMGTFKIGCKDTDYTHEVAEIQSCLGIKETGKFDSSTRSALRSRIGRDEIKTNEIPIICGDF